MIKLGVNVDHVATLREARKGHEPDPAVASALAEMAGADTITVHLREDRRHIQEHDLRRISETVSIPLNLEMACSRDVLRIAVARRPYQATLVPERREEVTTEGGLNVRGDIRRIRTTVCRLQDAGVRVSLFVDPDRDQVAASRDTGAEFIELHTGAYARSRSESDHCRSLESLEQAAAGAHELGLRINAGHGLNYANVQPICRIPHVEELNIGHSIVSRAIFVGIERAVREMKALMVQA